MIWQTRTLATYVGAAAPVGGEDGNPLVDSAQRIGLFEQMRGLPEEQQERLLARFEKANAKTASGEEPQRVAEPKVGSFENFMSTFGRVAHK